MYVKQLVCRHLLYRMWIMGILDERVGTT